MRAFTSETSSTMFRLPPGTDLLEGLTRAAKDREITAAWITVIGAVRNLAYGFYDQEAREYTTLTHDGELELASAMGNVSTKDGEPFVHLHVVCTDTDGSAIGGHLMPGTEVFVAEVLFQTFRGEGPVREHDEATGLAMWPTD